MPSKICKFHVVFSLVFCYFVHHLYNSPKTMAFTNPFVTNPHVKTPQIPSPPPNTDFKVSSPKGLICIFTDFSPSSDITQVFKNAVTSPNPSDTPPHFVTWDTSKTSSPLVQFLKAKNAENVTYLSELLDADAYEDLGSAPFITLVNFFTDMPLSARQYWKNLLELHNNPNADRVHLLQKLKVHHKSSLAAPYTLPRLCNLLSLATQKMVFLEVSECEAKTSLFFVFCL